LDFLVGNFPRPAKAAEKKANDSYGRAVHG